jgi:hypothetical protein
MPDILEDWRSNLRWRDHYVSWMTRGLSKTGSIGTDEVLPELSQVLSRDEVLWLYARLQESRRWEGEWRDEFLGIFSQVGPADLPSIPPEPPRPKWPTRQQVPRDRAAALPDEEILF